VRVDRDGYAAGDRREVRERLLERHVIIAAGHRPRGPGTRGGERGKSKLRQHARGAAVPRIRNDEAAGLVEVAKDGAAIDGHIADHATVQGQWLSTPHRCRVKRSRSDGDEPAGDRLVVRVYLPRGVS